MFKPKEISSSHVATVVLIQRCQVTEITYCVFKYKLDFSFSPVSVRSESGGTAEHNETANQLGFEDLLHFFDFCACKLKIFGFGLLVRQNQTTDNLELLEIVNGDKYLGYLS